MTPNGSGGPETPASRVCGTTPYAWPYDGRLDGTRLALLVVLPDDARYLPSAAAGRSAMAAAGDLAAAVSRARGLVVRVVPARPTPRSATPTVGDSAGAEGRAGATRPPAGGWVPPTAHLRVTAAGWDGFFGSGLDAVLRGWGRTHLLLAGAPLETAVHSTMRSANDRGYECLLVADACVPWAPGLVRNTLSMIEMSGGIFGAVGTTAAVLTAIGRAGPAGAIRQQF